MADRQILSNQTEGESGLFKKFEAGERGRLKVVFPDPRWRGTRACNALFGRPGRKLGPATEVVLHPVQDSKEDADDESPMLG